MKPYPFEEKKEGEEGDSDKSSKEDDPKCLGCTLSNAAPSC